MFAGYMHFFFKILSSLHIRMSPIWSCCSNDFVLQVGGQVWGLDWCPRNHQRPDFCIKCEVFASLILDMLPFPYFSYSFAMQYFRLTISTHFITFVWLLKSNCFGWSFELVFFLFSNIFSEILLVFGVDD